MFLLSNRCLKRIVFFWGGGMGWVTMANDQFNLLCAGLSPALASWLAAHMPTYVHSIYIH
jgi:hypothetical protein